MSGIAGIYHTDGQLASQETVGRMLDTLAHRGPDGSAVWCQGMVGLGHRMLHTTPESRHEVLPWSHREACLTITADARIDNREELLTALDLDQRPAGEVADSRLILAAYARWGTTCPERLLGDFAFAIWDGRRQQLFCARDAIGIKPFYYYQSARTFMFASEIKAILCLPEVPRRLNQAKVADFLVPIFADQVSTYYEEIVRLPPAHSLTVRAGHVRTWSYWSLDASREVRLGADEEYVEAFRELFTRAVDCRLRSAFPVGSTLSGGLDSSAIACTAGRLRAAAGHSRLHTFSAIFPSLAAEDPRIDERPYIDTVVALDLFEPHYVQADQCHPLAAVTWHTDEAWPAPGLSMSRALFHSAHEYGVRVLLSGFDGDGVVSYGYEYLDELARNGQWRDFAREAQALAQRRPRTTAGRYLQEHGMPSLHELARQWRWWALVQQVGEIATHLTLSRHRLLLQVALQPLRQAWQWCQDGGTATAAVQGLHQAIHPAFAKRSGLAQRLRACAAAAPTATSSLREQHRHALMSGNAEYVAQVFDQTAAPLGLELRYPFFDRRLMEFCLALPPRHKLWNGWTRVILRRAMEHTVPPAVQWRLSKGNLRLNVRRGLLAERDILEAVIVHDPGVIETYIDIAALRAAYRRYLAQPAAVSDADLFTIFLSVNLALWLRQSGFAAGWP